MLRVKHLLELKSKSSSELFKLYTSKIFGKEISSVILTGDKEDFDLALSYALTNIMIIYVSMLGANFLHRVGPSEDAALVITMGWKWSKTYTEFKEYIANPANLMGAV